MTQGQQDRPEDEPEEQRPQAEESQHTNYVPGSAADPAAGQSSPGMAGQAYYGPVSSPEERNWSMLVHLSALSGLLLPFANIIAPLIIWLIFRARSDMVDFHGKRALNFNISFLIYFIILFLAMIPFFIIGTIADVEQEIVGGFWETLALMGVSALLMFVLGVIWLIWTVVAAVRASSGNPPGYILAIAFLR